MTKRWWHVSISCRPEDSDRVAAAVIEATGQGVEEPSDGVITTVLKSESFAKQLVGDLATSFPGLEGSVNDLEPVDWTVKWRDGITSRRFGRLVVTPSWLPVTDGKESVVVTLDPESAFGSGEHGSTRAALTLLERLLRTGMRVVDFGSGSGILAIAAAKLGASRAIGIEIDDESLPIAEGNARRNQVDGVVSFLAGDADDLGPLSGPADLVCSNILRTVNVILLPTIAATLKAGGIAIFSGMEVAEEELFLPVLQASGWQVTDSCSDGDWWAVAAVRPQ